MTARLARLAGIAASLALAAAPAAAPAHDLGSAVVGAQIERVLAPAQCENLRSIGSRATALFVTRGSLTRADGSYDFAGIDADVDAERSCGIEPGLRVSAKTSSASDGYPSDPGAYAALLTALAGHLDGRVTRYAIDNEAASANHFPGSAEEYYALVRLSSSAIHAGDPDALVVDASMAYGALGVVEADDLLSQGRASEAVAVLREVQANELGGGPEVTDEAGLRAYLASTKAQRVLRFFELARQSQDAYDVFQVHYYGPSGALAAMIETVRRLGITRPIEIWELNHRYLDHRPYDDAEHAAEAARLLITAVGEGSAWTVYTNYFDHLDNSNFGLVDGVATPRAARGAFATVSAQLDGAVSGEPLDLRSGGFAYRFGAGGRELVAAWSAGGPVRARQRLGIEATSAAVTSLDGTRRDLRLSRLRLGPAPVFVEPDLLVVDRLHASTRRLRLALACPPASPRRHCTGELRVKQRGAKPLIRSYRVRRATSRRLRLRLQGRARRVTALADRCPDRSKRCRSFLDL